MSINSFKDMCTTKTRMFQCSHFWQHRQAMAAPCVHYVLLQYFLQISKVKMLTLLYMTQTKQSI